MYRARKRVVCCGYGELHAGQLEYQTIFLKSETPMTCQSGDKIAIAHRYPIQRLAPPLASFLVFPQITDLVNWKDVF
jgi:hypothetical protein